VTRYWLERQALRGTSNETLSYSAATRRLTIARDGSTETRTQTLFDYLDEALRANRSELPFPACGGYIGYFGYELRADCGSPVTHAPVFPDAMLMRIEHGDTQWPPADAVGLAVRTTPLRPRLSRAEYMERIAQCIRHIRDGEAYELCLTNQLDFETDLPALRYYEVLRRLNPAPYAAYLRFGDLEIACSSPECFLRVDRDGRVESRPIKGTLPRGRTPEDDESLRHQLATDPRFRAENLMITDLVRNDLGRVAKPGTVRVPGLMEVESYATVHQLVSTITAQLRPEATVVDCLRAAFPGGSMTGAPKLRAMELLDRMEPAARGIYSGSIGYLGFDGSADLNIVIRTAVFHRGHVGIGIGGAILAQSDPAAEWEETQLKAAALLRAFEVA
jgi:para-aminobenzoate synthetase